MFNEKNISSLEWSELWLVHQGLWRWNGSTKSLLYWWRLQYCLTTLVNKPKEKIENPKGWCPRITALWKTKEKNVCLWEFLGILFTLHAILPRDIYATYVNKNNNRKKFAGKWWGWILAIGVVFSLHLFQFCLIKSY